jgi:hypothetical protein
MDQEPMSDAEYLAKEAGQCPYCRSFSLKAQDSEFEGLHAWQKVECEECGAMWDEGFVMTGWNPRVS